MVRGSRFTIHLIWVGGWCRKGSWRLAANNDGGFGWRKWTSRRRKWGHMTHVVAVEVTGTHIGTHGFFQTHPVSLGGRFPGFLRGGGLWRARVPVAATAVVVAGGGATAVVVARRLRRPASPPMAVFMSILAGCGCA